MAARQVAGEAHLGVRHGDSKQASCVSQGRRKVLSTAPAGCSRGVKGPHAITEQSRFPEAIGRLSSCRKRACWLPGSSVSFPAPAAPFPKDSRTLSRKPISQMPPGSARQGAELHALSWAQKPGVWGPARAWPCQSPVGWEPRGLLGLSPASTKRLAGRGTSVGRRPRKATVILGLTSASRWQCSGPLYSSH